MTGLAFKTMGKDVILFVVTDNSLHTVNITAKDAQVGQSTGSVGDTTSLVIDLRALLILYNHPAKL